MKRILVLLLPTILFAVPAQVIIIRHAETPERSYSLSLKGRERAAALVPFFNSAPEVNFYGLPTAIFAPNDSADSIQTVQPLAANINVIPTKNFASMEVDQLSKEILTNPDYEGHMVLVCTRHDQIPPLAAALGAKKTPYKWKSDSYDRIWILTFNDKKEVTFKNIPQKLLFGDSK